MPESYKNVANHIRIPGLAEQAGLMPGSPTDIQLSVPMISLTTDDAADAASPPARGGAAVPPPPLMALPPAAMDRADRPSKG
jgi:hypothetical protein